MSQSAMELAQKVGVVFMTYATQKFEDDDKKGGPDARGREHGIVGDVPGGGYEARVDDVPVPKHLRGVSD
jgi:hypothetical protein